MKPVSEQIHEEVIDHLDRMIANAYEAKENYLLKRYEEAAANLDEVVGAPRQRVHAGVADLPHRGRRDGLGDVCVGPAWRAAMVTARQSTAAL